MIISNPARVDGEERHLNYVLSMAVIYLVFKVPEGYVAGPLTMRYTEGSGGDTSP